METSPRKQQSTSKVIDSLHSQIDELKSELESVKMAHGDERKKNSILANKTESLVDQLANCKHENDMINALLKRKERRITDLESELDSVCSSSESLKLSVKNYKIRCENLESSSVMSTNELERMKISYDALMAAQNEYKRHYRDELSVLTSQVKELKEEAAANMAELSTKFQSNGKDTEALLSSLSNKRAAMDNIYVSRTKVVMNSLALLAKVAKAHGEECQSILTANVDVVTQLREKFPDIAEKVAEHTETTIDLDELLGNSSAALDLSFDSSFSSLESDAAPRTTSGSRGKKKRNSMRNSSDYTDTQLDILPKVRNSPKPPRAPSGDQPRQSHQRQPSRRQNSTHDSPDFSAHRTSSKASSRSDSHNSHRFSGRATSVTGEESTGSTGHNSQNKSNRRSFLGGSNNYNKGNPDRRLSQKVKPEEVTN